MIDPSEVTAILLAAGLSRRFGSPKLSAPYRGKPLAMHAAETLRDVGFGSLLCVWSKATGSVADAISLLGYEMVEQTAPEFGLGTSLALAAERAASSGSKAVLVALADMPLVSRGHIMALLDAFDEPDGLVASSDGEVTMPPAIFGARHFESLLGLTGDQGARHLLVSARKIEAAPGELADIDVPDDLLSGRNA